MNSIRALGRIYFSPKGRISRLSYLRFGLLYPFGLGVLFELVGPFFNLWSYDENQKYSCLIRGEYSGELMLETLTLLIIVVITILSIKRFHDIGLSGWWYIVLMLIIYFLGFFASALVSAEYEINNYLDAVISFVAPYDCQPYFFDNFGGITLRLGSWAYIVIASFSAMACFLVRGTIGPNKYGPDPLERKTYA